MIKQLTDKKFKNTLLLSVLYSNALTENNGILLIQIAMSSCIQFWWNNRQNPEITLCSHTFFIVENIQGNHHCFFFYLPHDDELKTTFESTWQRAIFFFFTYKFSFLSTNFCPSFSRLFFPRILVDFLLASNFFLHFSCCSHTLKTIPNGKCKNLLQFFICYSRCIFFWSRFSRPKNARWNKNKYFET